MAEYKKKKRPEDEYVPLDNSGNDYPQMAGMSDIDRAAYRANADGYGRAQAAGDRKGMGFYHNAQEGIRARYGYSGGPDGSMYMPTGDRFDFDNAPTYINQRQQQIDSALAALQSRPAFAYDPEADPMYAVYRDQYTRNGQRAMQDTLGQMAARTGGLASSFAQTAGQQQYDNYMADLSAKVLPKLEQIAYQRAMDQEARERRNLETMMDLERRDYERFLNDRGQYNADRSFAYGQHRDAIGDRRYRDELGYSRDRDAEMDRRYGQEWQHQLDREAVEDQRYADEWAYKKQQDALSRADRRRSGGGGGGGGSPRDSSAQDYNSLFMDAYESGHPKSYIANNYKDYGFKSSSGLYDEFEGMDFVKGDSPSFDYDEDEGIFSFNGKAYNKVEDLEAALSSTAMTQDQYESLVRKLQRFGLM